MAPRTAARRPSLRASSSESARISAKGRVPPRRWRRWSGRAAPTRRARARACRGRQHAAAAPRSGLLRRDGSPRRSTGSVRRWFAPTGAPPFRLARTIRARSRTAVATASRGTPAIRASGRSRSSGHRRRENRRHVATSTACRSPEETERVGGRCRRRPRAEPRDRLRADEALDPRRPGRCRRDRRRVHLAASDGAR